MTWEVLPTDQPTDKAGCRVACTPLKIPEYLRELYETSTEHCETLALRHKLQAILKERAGAFAKSKIDTGDCNLVKHVINTEELVKQSLAQQ